MIRDKILFFYFLCLLNCGLNSYCKETKEKVKRGDKIDTTIVNSILEKSTVEIRKKNFDRAKQYAQLAKVYSEKLNYTSGKADALYTLAVVAKNRYEFESEIKYLYETLSLYKKLDSKPGLAKVINTLGVLFWKLGNHDKAIEYFLEALKLYEGIGDYEGESKCYNNIGIIFHEEKKADKALEYYFKSLTKKQKTGNLEGIIISYINIGNVYLEDIKEYAKAKLYYYKAEKINTDSLHSDLYTAAYLKNVGDVNYEEGNYSSAIVLHKKSKEIFEELKMKERINSCLISLGKDYIKTYQYDSAEAVLKSAMESFIKLDSKLFLRETYKYLNELHLKKNNYEKAYKYHLLYTEVNELLISEKTRLAIIEKTISYETEKKDKEIELLVKDRQQKEAERRSIIARSNLIIVSITAFTLLLLLLLAYLNARKKKLQQRMFTKELIQQQEEERKRISKELHDGIGQNLLAIKTLNIEGRELLEQTIEDVRIISRNMHPVQLEKLGFKKAIESVIESLKRNNDVFFSYEIDDVDNLLNDLQKINLYRIIQECLSNVIKHSKSTAAKVTIEKKSTVIEINVYDKGVGFNLDEVKKNRTLGLFSIMERVNLIGGDLSINTSNKGTQVTITIKQAL